MFAITLIIHDFKYCNMENATTVKKIISYLTFSLGEEHFAINVGNVVNILELQEITKVPKSPSFLTGMINLRGEVLPVIDTNIKLGMEKTQYSTNTCILVIETTRNKKLIQLGLLVDSVHEVMEIEDEDILKTPGLIDNNMDLLSGVIEHRAKFIMLLDINKLLNANEVTTIQKLSRSTKKS